MSARRPERMTAVGLAGWAVARLAAADRADLAEAWTVPVLSFTPQAAVAAWACAALARSRGTALAAALAGTALTAAIVPRAVPRRRPDAAGPTLRLLTANLRMGQAEAGSLVELVRRTGADVLLVQELTDGAVARLHRAGLGDLLPDQRLSPVAAGGGGGGIYARCPLSAGHPAGQHRFAHVTARLDLPARAPGSEPVPRPAGAGPMKRPPASVQLVCVHLPPPKPWSTGGAARWRAELTALPPPPGPGEPGEPGQSGETGEPALILAGDFNATLDHVRFRRLLRLGYTDAASQAGRGLVPTWGPRICGRPALLALDHVLVDPRCAVGAVSAHPLPGSDHRALCAEIRLPG